MKTTPSVYTVVVSNLGQVFKGLNRGKARLDFDHYVLDSKSTFGRARGEEVTLFEDDEILKHYDPSVQPAQPPAIESITDEDRMNFLVNHIVEVRQELRCGSRFLFVSQATYNDPGTDKFTGTTLRAQIDAALLAENKEKKVPNFKENLEAYLTKLRRKKMAAKKLNVAKVKGTTTTGMSFEIEGNIAGVCQELFNYIGSAAVRQKVIEAIQAQHIAIVEHETMSKREEAALKHDFNNIEAEFGKLEE